MKYYFTDSNTKPLAYAIVVCLILLIVFSVWFMCMPNDSKCNLYAMTTIVIDVDYNNDLVTCKDFNGNLWCFEGCEDWQTCDIASLLMSDNSTQTIYDDTIEDARYNGWLEGLR